MTFIEQGLNPSLDRLFGFREPHDGLHTKPGVPQEKFTKPNSDENAGQFEFHRDTKQLYQRLELKRDLT